MLIQSRQSTSLVLHILIPDLFTHHSSVTPGLRFKALEKLLSLAEIKEWEQPEFRSSLFFLFGLPTQSPLPVAPITRLYDVGDSSDKIWLRADPVHLRVNLDHVILFDAASAFTISREETELFIEELNKLYSEDGLQFSAPSPTRWYVCLPEMPKLITSPLSEVIGRDIHDYMPDGEDKRRWRQILNEIQMLLHQSPVNANREARGELPINSVWFWGLGQLPESPPARWTQVWSDDLLTQGLARLANTPQTGVPPTGVDWLTHLTQGEHLLTLLISPKEPMDWSAWLKHLETVWFEPLFKALKQRQVSAVVLYPGDKRVFLITDTHTHHWWRWRRNWQHFIPTDT